MNLLTNFFSVFLSEWRIAGTLFLITWILAVIFAFFIKYKKNSVLTPINILFVGTFISSLIYFIPIYSVECSPSVSFMNSFQHALRLFALDGDYKDWILAFEHYPDKVTKSLYIWLGAALYAFAPVMTFGFILSFFKNLSAHLKYICCFWAETHVFSKLNEKTLTLATDLFKKQKPLLGIFPRMLIVFTDIVDKEEEETLELIEDAQALGAILYRKDLESIKFRHKLSLRKLNFYLISEDESEKVRHTDSIMENYDFKDVTLRVFSEDIRTELLLPTKTINNMRVARVNDIQSLIYHNLDINGINLFKRARENGNGEKIISAVIVGLGRYGCEMLKALTWYCQVSGYKLVINVFDSDPNALEKFTAICPELMSDKLNGVNIPGEPYYHIKIHSGIDVSVPDFADKLSAITDATYILVCLGDDKTNLNVSTSIRTLCERVKYEGDGHKPDIETIIYDSNIYKTMSISWDDVWDSVEGEAKNETRVHGITNYKKQPYNILMIGDLEHFYSADTVLNSELVNAGWEVHWRYYTEGKEEKKADEELKKAAERTFWQFGYNYNSSIAKALHERLRVKLKLQIPGINKPWETRTEEEKLAIGSVEHIRWNAYMRTEGYCLGAKRNDLAKEHHNLVPVTALSDDDLRKDA